MRGFKKDVTATLEALATGMLQDRRSFISMPKVTGDPVFVLGIPFTGQAKPHLILYGDDKGPVRAEIFRRNREANGGTNRCWKCKCVVYENEEAAQMAAPPNFIMKWWSRGEWDHIRNKSGQRCDCPENGRVGCRSCHKERHPRVKLGEAVQV